MVVAHTDVSHCNFLKYLLAVPKNVNLTKDWNSKLLESRYERNFLIEKILFADGVGNVFLNCLSDKKHTWGNIFISVKGWSSYLGVQLILFFD